MINKDFIYKYGAHSNGGCYVVLNSLLNLCNTLKVKMRIVEGLILSGDLVREYSQP
jgi:hypothetical protein